MWPFLRCRHNELAYLIAIGIAFYALLQFYNKILIAMLINTRCHKCRGILYLWFPIYWLNCMSTQIPQNEKYTMPNTIPYRPSKTTHIARSSCRGD